MITISWQNDSDWYNDSFEGHTVQVNEFLKCNYESEQHIDLEQVLDRLLPIKKTNALSLIEKKLRERQVEYQDIRFDTFHNRYIIEGEIAELARLQSDKQATDSNPTYLYKYMSLKTYLSMLQNKSFRMNSIISMNDISEASFLGDLLCNAYKNKKLRNNNYVNNKTILISSFTSLCDDALMWRLYGDNGQGVCMCFRINHPSLKPIVYINEYNPKLSELRKIAEYLENESIHIYFKDIDNYQYYVKSDQFEYEQEYRLKIESKNENLSFTPYENLIAFYQDFRFKETCFEKIELTPYSLIIGANMPNSDINYPLLVDLSNRIFNITNINLIRINKLRL